MSRSILSLVGLLLIAAPTAFAQGVDDMGPQSCFHERQLYPNGAELCLNGALMRCEDGSWDDMGECQAQAPAPPDSQGGDEVEPED